MKRVLVTSCNSRFALGAEALLRSAQRCHPEIDRVCFVPPAEHAALSLSLGNWAEICPFPAVVRGVPETRQANVGRLFVAAVETDVAAYVDADIIFCRPAPELWDVRAGTVNAVLDDSIVISNNLGGDNLARYRRQFPSTAMKKGVNAGAFALRPAEWKNLISEFEEALISGGYQYESIIDQPLLNGLFDGRINTLPGEFNAQLSL